MNIPLEQQAAHVERLLTLGDIQRAAVVSRPTVWKWRAEHGLKMIRVGGCVRVRESDWLAWLEKHATEGNGNGEATP